jgi:hypothetical protein
MRLNLKPVGGYAKGLCAKRSSAAATIRKKSLPKPNDKRL